MDVQYLRQRSTYRALVSADSRIINCQLSTTELIIQITHEESNLSLQFYTIVLVTSTYSHAEVSIQNTCSYFSIDFKWLGRAWHYLPNGDYCLDLFLINSTRAKKSQALFNQRITYRPLLGLSDTMTEWDFINQIFKASCQIKTVDHTAMTISLIISI